MNETEQRRTEILKVLKNNKELTSGTKLAEIFDVSRQVIVQDIAILKAEGNNIHSTNRGYRIYEEEFYKKVFKTSHKDNEIAKELNAIVDLGAIVKDVFINHKVYGKISVEMNIKSRRDVKKFLETIDSGISQPLKNLTENYHYHTIIAEEEEILDDVEEVLKSLGYLIEY